MNEGPFAWIFKRKSKTVFTLSIIMNTFRMTLINLMRVQIKWKVRQSED